MTHSAHGGVFAQSETGKWGAGIGAVKGVAWVELCFVFAGLVSAASPEPACLSVHLHACQAKRSHTSCAVHLHNVLLFSLAAEDRKLHLPNHHNRSGHLHVHMAWPGMQIP